MIIFNFISLREKERAYFRVFFFLCGFLKQTHVGFGVIIEWTTSVCKCIYSETDAAMSCMFWMLKPKCKATLMWNEENENGLWYLFLANLNGVFELLWFPGDSDREERDLHCMLKSIELKCCLCNGWYFHMIALNLECKIPSPVFDIFQFETSQTIIRLQVSRTENFFFSRW